MKTCVRILMLMAFCMALPMLSNAQGYIGNGVSSLNDVLNKLFDEMLPMCNQLIDVGRALAGFAALFYIAFRVWKHLARAEPIDFYPLLRPFAIGIAILLFPQVIALMNGVLSPVEKATSALAQNSRKAIEWSIEQEEKSIKAPPPPIYAPGDNNGMEKYEQPGNSTETGGLFSAFSVFNFKSVLKMILSDLFGIIYAAAALCINAIRTFYLIILAILGPIVFGLSVFDGFQHTLASWFARYINIYMWLPVANIFGGITSKILENMLTLDQGFFSSTAYIIFMIIAVIGYTHVPNIAGYIIQAGGKDTLLHKVSDMSRKGVQMGAKAAIGMF